MIVDAAQSVPHIKVDVKEIDCDALVFSGHKVYAPTGSGVLYCKEDILNELPPFMGGGEMILSVSKEGFEMNELPWRFEAGTPDIESGIVLGETIKWFEKTVNSMGGYDGLINHERTLMKELLTSFDEIGWFRPFGKVDYNNRYGALAFNIEGFSFKGCKEKAQNNQEGSRIVEYISKKGICVREGFHCAEPLHDAFHVGPTMRASFGIYNRSATSIPGKSGCSLLAGSRWAEKLVPTITATHTAASRIPAPLNSQSRVTGRRPRSRNRLV